jgi:hypothetical protein
MGQWGLRPTKAIPEENQVLKFDIYLYYLEDEK